MEHRATVLLVFGLFHPFGRSYTLALEGGLFVEIPLRCNYCKRMEFVVCCT